MWRSRLRSTLIAVMLSVTVFACSMFAETKTPIQAVPESSRFAMEERGGKPVAIRLTQSAIVSGLSLPLGSIMRQTDNASCSIFPSEPMMVGRYQVPAASEIELVLRDGSFVWNGFVMLGDSANFQGLEVAAGDSVFFTGDLPHSPVLAQIKLGDHREVAGQWYPSGTIVYVNASGVITNISATMGQAELSTQQQSYHKQKIERESQCNEICASHKDDPAALNSCMEYCLSR